MRLRWAALCGLFTTVFCPSWTHATEPGSAQWTVLVFMNGDNNLEQSLIDDFREMARVGSNENVRVLVQLDRSNKYSVAAGNWAHTLRFEVPSPSAGWSEPLVGKHIPNWSKEADMGKGRSVVDFVQWGMKYRPAAHYALILSGHGNGGRAEDMAVSNARTMGPDENNGAHQPSRLYIRDLQDALRGMSAATPSRHLDVIGFDACLMGGIEAQYAMRSVADVIISSEEEEPKSGWEYEDLLTRLNLGVGTDPEFSAEDFGRVVVESYSVKGPGSERTLAALRTSGVAPLAARISALGDVAGGQPTTTYNSTCTLKPSVVAALSRARDECFEYGGASIDITCFATHLKESPTFEAAAGEVLAALETARISKTASVDRRLDSGFGAEGTSIYFPRSRQHADEETLFRGPYGLNGTTPVSFPVEFASDPALHWSQFLLRYLSCVAKSERDQEASVPDEP